jgi:hypothetical protein
MVVRGSLVVMSMVPLVLVAVGCGGSRAPSVASVAPTNKEQNASSTSLAPAGGSVHGSNVAWAACMTTHGIATAATGDGVSTSNVDPSSSLLEMAYKACAKLWSDAPPQSAPKLSPAQEVKAAHAMLDFASCMRQHDVLGFPDPNGQGTFSMASMQGIDPNSPLVQTAFKTCEPLESKVGPSVVIGRGVIGERG